jgi:23S rRNA (cytosine1962-C5)-methyltransferase
MNSPVVWPPRASARLALRVSPPAERALKSGHPWLFEGSIQQIKGHSSPSDPSIQPGTVAVIFDRKNRFLGAGLWDPDGPIRVRMHVFGTPENIGAESFRSRITVALDRRRPLLNDPETTGIRLLHGEGDGFSGLVADLYGAFVVVKVYSRSWLPWLETVLDELQAGLLGYGIQVQGILLRTARKVGRTPGAPAWLSEPTMLSGAFPDAGAHPDAGALPFLEGGLRYESHPLVGHKTGFYLDQRENRSRVRELCANEGKLPLSRVLNVFSYTGGFSLAAAAGGAKAVTSLDVSQQALAQAERHFSLNAAHPRVAKSQHSIYAGDAFQGMEALAAEGQRFGLVVVDPPSFAKEATQETRAIAQYGRLTRLALRLLVPGGILVQASCSSRVQTPDFLQGVHDAARAAGRELEELECTGHPVDHPIGFSEGAYLKAIFARAP